MSDIINLGISIYNGVRNMQARKKAKKSYFEMMPGLLERQHQIGNLERASSGIPVPAPQPDFANGSVPPAAGTGAAPAGAAAASAPETVWVTTERTTHAGLEVYGDIWRALDYFKVTPQQREALGLSTRVTIRQVSTGTTKDAHAQLGRHWPQQLKDRLLADPFSNPFLSRRFPAGTKYHFPACLIWKVGQSDGYGDLFVPRLLFLAQLCGLHDITLMGFMQLVMHASQYEQLARAFLAAMIGNIDKSAITNLALGNMVNGRPLGSVQNFQSNFSGYAAQMTGQMVQIGVIRGRELVLSYPKSVAELEDITLKIPSDSKAQEGEPVYMLSGWAEAMALRTPDPSPYASSPYENGVRPISSDIHGSPLYRKFLSLTVSVKRIGDNRLIAKASRFGYLPPHTVTGGQGVFGKPCGCSAPNPNRRFDAGNTTMVNGVVVETFQTLEHKKYGEDHPWYTKLNIHWAADDFISLIWYADMSAYPTYIQVPGECLYCAVNRAFGTGCLALVAGAFSDPNGIWLSQPTG